MLNPKLHFSQLVLLVSLHQSLHQPVYATNRNVSCAESCGKISIRYPFRLKTDHESCGVQDYQISCEDNNVAAINMHSAKYYVKAINYDNFTIRLAEANVQKNNLCSLPADVQYSDFPYYASADYFFPYFPDSIEDLVFVTCQKPVISPNYVDTCSSSCCNFSYSYVVVGITDVWYLEETCRIDRIYFTALKLSRNGKKNINYEDVHFGLVYGFGLSWFYGCCLNTTENLCNLNKSIIDRCLTSIEPNPDINRYGILRSIILKLEKTPLAFLLYKLHWFQPVFGDFVYLDFKGYLFVLLRYVFLLFVLYRAPLFLCGILCAIIFFIRKWRRRHLSEYGTVEEFLQNHNNLMPIRYSYADLKKITNGFKEKLGHGGYGSVYKGKLRSGYFAAVKILGRSKTNGQDFINEVATIGRIHHVNVVRLIGFCVEGSRRALVYELMPNGSLDKYLFSQENSNTLSIEKMYEISLGVARGIEYLHRGCDMQILHFDIKPHNILLDENFTPKVSDFGLAKLYPANDSIVTLTAARGTMGYMAPELVYKSIGCVSYKADVYSFGKLLMEMATRRKRIESSGELSSHVYPPSWIHDQLNEGRDIEIEGETEEERLITKKMILVALWCVQMRPKDRPSMHKVMEMLEGEIESIEMPPKPYFSPFDQLPKESIGINGSEGLREIPNSYLDSISWMVNGR